MSRYQRDPITGSIIPIAGYMAPDNVLNTTSEKPIQNQAIANPIEAMLNVYGSKNLLPLTMTTQSDNGVTFTVNSDGSVTVSGAVTSGAGHASVMLGGSFTIPKGFILTGCPAGGSDSTYRLDLTKATGTIVVVKDFGEGAVTTQDVTYDYARIVVWEGAGNVNLTFYPMIRDPRIVDGSYVPYAMSNRELTDYTQKVSGTLSAASTFSGSQIIPEYDMFKCLDVVFLCISYCYIKSSINKNTWISVLQVPDGFKPKVGISQSGVVTTASGHIAGLVRVAIGTDGVIRIKTDTDMATDFGISGINLIYRV